MGGRINKGSRNNEGYRIGRGERMKGRTKEIQKEVQKDGQTMKMKDRKEESSGRECRNE